MVKRLPGDDSMGLSSFRNAQGYDVDVCILEHSTRRQQPNLEPALDKVSQDKDSDGGSVLPSLRSRWNVAFWSLAVEAWAA